MTLLEQEIERQRAQLKRSKTYSADWYARELRLSLLVKKWRESNTLHVVTC